MLQSGLHTYFTDILHAYPTNNNIVSADIFIFNTNTFSKLHSFLKARKLYSALYVVYILSKRLRRLQVWWLKFNIWNRLRRVGIPFIFQSTASEPLNFIIIVRWKFVNSMKTTLIKSLIYPFSLRQWWLICESIWKQIFHKYV